MVSVVWQKCLEILESEFAPQQFNTWLRPLQVELSREENTLLLLAPNRFVVDWVKKNFYTRIQELVGLCSDGLIQLVSIEIGSHAPTLNTPLSTPLSAQPVTTVASVAKTADHYKNSYLNKKFEFDTFVEGKSVNSKSIFSTPLLTTFLLRNHLAISRGVFIEFLMK